MDIINKKPRVKKVMTWSLLAVIQGFVLMFLISKFNLPNLWSWILFIIILAGVVGFEIKYLNVGKMDEEIIEEIKGEIK